MTICGISVRNVKYGNGVISSCDNKVVYVSFPQPDGSKKEIKFLFPDAFTQKFLVSSDPRLEEYVHNYIKEMTCSFCGKENLPTIEVDGKRLCKACEQKHTKKCSKCEQVHLADEFSSVSIPEYPYYISLCDECYSRYVHKCDDCGKTFIADDNVHTFEGKTYCDRCYERMICICDICGVEYIEKLGKRVYDDGDYLDACPKCVQEKTFVCSECERHVLTKYLVSSKFISADKQICHSCVSHCHSCGEAIDYKHTRSYFGHAYCTECEATKKLECPICGDEFIPDTEDQTVCPECVDAIDYMEEVQKIDFSSRQAKVMSVYSLDVIDRCKLFTNLYENCRALETGKEAYNTDKPYHYIIMSILGYNAVLTYLPRELSGKIRNSANVTMTELRSSKGRSRVYSAIKKWLPDSDHALTIPEGKVQLLHYPPLIRAQTEYDKVYGKEWNGPDDYIEIGNYGDTTDFYIIGVLNKEN